MDPATCPEMTSFPAMQPWIVNPQRKGCYIMQDPFLPSTPITTVAMPRLTPATKTNSKNIFDQEEDVMNQRRQAKTKQQPAKRTAPPPPPRSKSSRSRVK
jgi:hypothetical protein